MSRQFTKERKKSIIVSNSSCQRKFEAQFALDVTEMQSYKKAISDFPLVSLSKGV